MVSVQVLLCRLFDRTTGEYRLRRNLRWLVNTQVPLFLSILELSRFFFLLFLSYSSVGSTSIVASTKLGWIEMNGSVGNRGVLFPPLPPSLSPFSAVIYAVTAKTGNSQNSSEFPIFARLLQTSRLSRTTTKKNRIRIWIRNDDPSPSLFYSLNKRFVKIHKAGVCEVTTEKIREIGDGGEAESSWRNRVTSYTSSSLRVRTIYISIRASLHRDLQTMCITYACSVSLICFRPSLASTIHHRVCSPPAPAWISLG